MINNGICPITGMNISFEKPSEYGSVYRIEINGQNQIIELPDFYSNWGQDRIYTNNKHIIAGLLLNGQLFELYQGAQKVSLELFKEKLVESLYPKLPQEKYDYLLQRLFNLQEYEGAIIEMAARFQSIEFYHGLFFKNRDELTFYIKTLYNDGLLHVEFFSSMDYPEKCNLTYKGLSYVLKLMDEGKQSKNCFIAMSFGSKMGSICSAIKEACEATGYIPVIVDENAHFASDTTINDAIIASLKKCRFCIADFTEQKDGVYFESGFALGQGKEVIYTCREDHFKDLHFDTRQFPYIKYKDPDELKEMLITRIQARLPIING
jgi:hypothetical protein